MPRILGLEPQFFLLFLVVPVLLLIFALYLLWSYGQRQRRELAQIFEATDLITQFSGRSMNNRLALSELIEAQPEGEVEGALQRLLDESELKYNDRWLPPPEQELKAEIFRDYLRRQRSLARLIPLLIVVAMLASALLFLLLPQGRIPTAAYWLPLVLGLVLAGSLIYSDRQYRRELESELEGLSYALGRAFPVFNDRAGVALLVDDLLAHENKLDESFQSFNETARYLANSEFAGGIQKAVREVMSSEISPPIRDSAKLMQELSKRLISEQEEGMSRLAGQFAQSVAEKLSTELRPISTQLAEINSLIAATREFIHDSVAVLETSRQQNISLNNELTESLRLMTEAKNDLANEMSEISGNLEVITGTTEKMAAIYAGEEARLSARMAELSDSMRSAFRTLSEALAANGKSIELATSVKTEQAEQNTRLLAHLQSLNEEINTLAENLAHSSRDFTQESSSYVNKTLQEFDSGLAEVVERLIFTASAIRDAVEALPVALRPNKDI